MARLRRIIVFAFIVALIGGAAYGFWWWRVQEMDSERCAAAIQGFGAAAPLGEGWRYSKNSTPWEDRKYKEAFSTAEILLNEFMGRYCD